MFTKAPSLPGSPPYCPSMCAPCGLCRQRPIVVGVAGREARGKLQADPRVQRMPCPTNTSVQTVLLADLIHWVPFIGYRTACATNTPVRTVFLEDFTVRWKRGGGGGAATHFSFLNVIGAFGFHAEDVREVVSLDLRHSEAMRNHQLGEGYGFAAVDEDRKGNLQTALAFYEAACEAFLRSVREGEVGDRTAQLRLKQVLCGYMDRIEQLKALPAATESNADDSDDDDWTPEPIPDEFLPDPEHAPRGEAAVPGPAVGASANGRGASRSLEQRKRLLDEALRQFEKAKKLEGPGTLCRFVCSPQWRGLSAAVRPGWRWDCAHEDSVLRGRAGLGGTLGIMIPLFTPGCPLELE